MALRLLGEQQIAQQLFSEMKQWAQEMAKTSIEADFFAVSQPDLLSLYGDLQQQHKEKMPDGGDAGVRGTRGGCAI